LEEGADVLIDCDSCRVRDLACRDCVVPVLLGGPGAAESPERTVELDGAEQAAIAVLARSGLVPPLRLVSDRVVRQETPRRAAAG
jgi:hypothetical protein